LLTLNQISTLIFFNLYMKVLFFHWNLCKVQRIGISFSSFIYTWHLHCRKIHNLFVRALETGRKVCERKLSRLMKKMKESGKLDINKRLTNHSARKNLLQKLRENNVERTDIMQISGLKNVASINNYSTLSEERHKKISNISDSNTETNRNALVPVVSNLPRKTSTNSTASSTSDVSCRSNPDVPSYCANTNMSSQISSMFYGAVLHVNTLNQWMCTQMIYIPITEPLSVWQRW